MLLITEPQQLIRRMVFTFYLLLFLWLKPLQLPLGTLNLGRYINIIPILGIIIFAILFIVSANLYAGGNYLNNSADGFSILHNYWCDLLNPIAHNGQQNPSTNYAIAATIILCSSLIIFWYSAPKTFNTSSLNKSTIQITGTLSMLAGMMIFTRLHSEAITMAGFFGGIAFIATIVGLYSSKWNKLFWLGIVCLFLGVITFTIYKIRVAIIILPMIQKVTLAVCLVWILAINRKVNKQGKI